MSSTTEKFFQNGIDTTTPRKMNAESGCAVLFYAAILVQLIMGFVIFGSKNSEVATIGGDGVWQCPGDYVLAESCLSGGSYGNFWDICVNQNLCDEVRSCTAGRGRRLDDASAAPEPWSSSELIRRLAAEEGPATPRRQLHRNLARRLASGRKHVPADLWAFMEEHAYQPVVLFLCAIILATVWLFFLQKAAKAAIWGTIAADIIMLLAVFLWYLIDFAVTNWACIVGVAAIVGGAIAARNQISDTAVILTQAMLGLRANARIFAVSAGVQVVWVLYFAQWIAALISMHFVMRVTPDDDAGACVLRGHSMLSNNWMAIYFVLCYYWVTYFARNVNLMLVTANISGWYFRQEGSASFWLKALPWSVGVQGGGNALGSAVMGACEYLMNRIGGTWGLVFSMLTPWNWILVCIALAMKTVLQTYTKFGLIAMTFSGKSFCESAGKAFQLMTSKLGSAVLTDYLGSRIMAWASYMIALSVGLAAWAWADDVQGISTFGGLTEVDGSILIAIVIMYAYLLSYPFITLVVLILIESNFGSQSHEEIRAVLNSVLASLFMGSITMFILSAISKLVVNAMDVVFFCFAVEADNQGRQERFTELYSSIKCSIVEGGIQGQNVVQGNAVSGQQLGPVAPSEPTVVVVGSPVQTNNVATTA
eukprot:CAMPEP_0171057392 /NCGR_PEP_ID=MMETSP0766_2-20121228/1763_1 /TAXON_ID=439317 /ORGANISM="Gambierdiscus australes, Strain CAWD 149" /LENGTH=649 /DNA_ID=CAMNT_0011512497 /DNA_START=66 /DNA_END=2015 /DNA_ORIENTATION=-